MGRRRAAESSAGPPGPAIEATGVTREFDGRAAVEDLDLVVPAGTIIGLIGPSGCGKTTTVRMMAGILPPTSGHLRVLGRDPARFRVRDRSRIGYMPQQPVLYPELSLWDNLQFCASLYGVRLRQRRRHLLELLELVDLVDHRRTRLAHASGGMQRRLSLAATLVHGPDLIYLDEPTAGIDPILRDRFWEHFHQLRDGQRTLVVTTQYVGEATHCDLVGVMSDARLVVLDTPEGLRRQAFAGEVVDVTTTAPVGAGDLAALQQLPQVRGTVERRPDGSLRVPVDEAAAAIPTLINWFEERPVTVEGIQPYLPDYDEVFVAIVERARERRAAEDQAVGA